MTTRERLMDAARDCLLEHGHQACSVKAIAERAGVNHGLVHHYFGSKEGLWQAVIQREVEAMHATLEATPRFLDGFFLPELLRHPQRMRLALEFLSMSRSHPAVAESLREQFRLNRKVLRRQLGLPDETSATLAFATFFGLVIHSGLDPDLDVQPAAERLLELLTAQSASPAHAHAGRTGHSDAGKP
ncbi:MAG TPA: TetR/AcrR family transcriptional regulator [bacterium]|nr:TetR/AcrR family transcriptional regulator [bacterium]